MHLHHLQEVLTFVQGDQNVSVHLTQCIRTIPTQPMIWRWPTENSSGMWTVLYWTRSSRTQFGVSISVWRLVGNTLNITCNFLYCNHLVRRDFLITLYFVKVTKLLTLQLNKVTTLLILSCNFNKFVTWAKNKVKNVWRWRRCIETCRSAFDI